MGNIYHDGQGRSIHHDVKENTNGANNRGPLFVSMGQRQDQKGENPDEDELEKNHKDHFEPLLLVAEDQEEDDVGTLDGRS